MTVVAPDVAYPYALLVGTLCCMPAPQTPTDWREQWLPVIFWIGVGLAPLAALFLLLGQGGGPLRLAAVLGILSAVLIGLSVALRNDVDAVRTELEETILDEADAVRDDARRDMVAVARKLHARVSDEITDLSEQVAELRAQLDGAGRSRRTVVTDLAEEAAAFTRGVVHRTETVRVSSEWRASATVPVSGAPVSGAPISGAPVSGAPVSGAPVSGGPTREERGGRHSWREEAIHYTPTQRSASETIAASARVSVSEYRVSGDGYRRDEDGYRRDDDDEPTDQIGRRRAESYSGRRGRRRAAEPDEPIPIAEIEAPRPIDPWADLRGTTQPAEVRFSSYGSSYGSAERVRVTQEPGPLDPGWYPDHYR